MYGVVDAWTKYHQGYLSVEDRKHVENTIGIARLNQLIADRISARAKRDFAKTDQIRNELLGVGIVLKDAKDRTTWEIAR
ncbi:CysS/YqeB C-terminal domain-containing protein [Bradyrhizobium oligotrophicum]|uniref:CysS/YqeB C-terminal domain-containing protein n=1 Tax=Bradyrhizobium TaxID=374 RepID=UPI003EB89FEA